jgi:hypothetical protein
MVSPVSLADRPEPVLDEIRFDHVVVDAAPKAEVTAEADAAGTDDAEHASEDTAPES